MSVEEISTGAELQAGPSKKISVIIPAHNEEAFLPKALMALQLQSFREFEVIVVSNGSTDRTEEAARPLCNRCVALPFRALGKARNLGARLASGKLLLFLDADTILPPDTLEKIDQTFTRKYAMGTVQGVPDRPKRAYQIIYLVKNLIHRLKIHYGSSGVIICWKDYFERVGGFDEQLYLRENSDLMKRLRPFGPYKYLSGAQAITSMRRYDEKGTREMVALWFRVWCRSLFTDIHNQTYEKVEGEIRGEQSSNSEGPLRRKTASL